jgi:hypothetical protein
MNWFQKNFKTIIYTSFLVPILTVAFVSISHVTKWYGISNPVSWSIYLSVGIEIAALSALAAISAKMGKKVYFPFGIVTLIQFIGNIFFAYQYIDVNSDTFKDWMDLVNPLVSFLGVESGDPIGHKRFLALFAGGMLPLISLSFLHMLVKFEEEEKKKEVVITVPDEVDIDALSIEAGKLEAEMEKEKYTPTEEELKKLEEILLTKTPQNAEEITSTLEPDTKDTPQEDPEFDGFPPELLATREEINKLLLTDEEISDLEYEEPVEEVIDDNQPKINRLSYVRRDG